MLDVMKKDGTIVPWDNKKISNAVKKASNRCKNDTITNGQLTALLIMVHEETTVVKYDDKEYLTTTDIHELVLQFLERINYNVFLEYKAYRKYKETYTEAFESAKEFAEKVVFTGDKENANRDSTLNSTKQTLIAEGLMRELMLKFELEPEWTTAHEEGWIHIHDLAQRYSSQINCCLFDIANVMKDGFELNGAKYIEPKSIQAAWAVAGDVTLSASSNQLGGFTLPEIDKALSPYAEKSYIKHKEILSNSLNDIPNSKEIIEKLAMEYTLKEIEQGYQGFETKLNTISNSLAQVPFVTISFGLQTGFWEKKISEAILKVRKKGMGEDGMTAIFPKLVFLHRNEINGLQNSPNYDLYAQAIDCSKTRLYPDYLSLDEGNLKEIYDRSGKAVSPMG